MSGRNGVFNKTNYIPSLEGLMSLNITPVMGLLQMGRKPYLEVMKWKGDIVPHHTEYRTPKGLSLWPYVQEAS
jgi:hypothetical protein